VRRGQAALEYLVTYGWGFVIIIVVVGALAYLGFLNPTRYIPARCSFGSQLECVDDKLEARGVSGTIYLKFRNNFGDDIRIVDAFTTNSRVTPTIQGAGSAVIARGNVSSIFVITLTGVDDPLISGEKMTVPLTITFQRNPGGALHNVTGEVFGVVQ
jgi:hypothetical protein